MKARFAQEYRDQPPEPSLVCRHYQHPNAARLPVSGGNHGLAQSQGPSLAAIK